MNKRISLAVACSENRVIARDGMTPWRIPEDLAHFHRITEGQTVVVGRITYEVWPRVALDGRRPIVITRSRALPPLPPLPPRPQLASSSSPVSKVRVAANLAEALVIAATLPGDEVLIGGGQQIFEELIETADRIYLTLVHTDVPGDRFFPEWRHLNWRESERRESHDENYRYTFSTLDRLR